MSDGITLSQAQKLSEGEGFISRGCEVVKIEDASGDSKRIHIQDESVRYPLKFYWESEPMPRYGDKIDVDAVRTKWKSNIDVNKLQVVYKDEHNPGEKKKTISATGIYNRRMSLIESYVSDLEKIHNDMVGRIVDRGYSQDMAVTIANVLIPAAKEMAVSDIISLENSGQLTDLEPETPPGTEQPEQEPGQDDINF